MLSAVASNHAEGERERDTRQHRERNEGKHRYADTVTLVQSVGGIQNAL
jgi:hypothetical protein